MSRKATITEFINDAKSLHGNKYDYSKSIYTNRISKIEIVCPEHGSFFQDASHHLRKPHPHGCPRCAGQGMTVDERFWDSIDKNGPIANHMDSRCWIWVGNERGNGYGQILVDGKKVQAHRYSYELYYGTIPTGMLICHHCDVPLCVNPDHLFLGTSRDNAIDRTNKGKSQYGERNYNAKFTSDDIVYIRKLWNTGLNNSCQIARMYNVVSSTIWSIVNNKTWRHVNA